MRSSRTSIAPAARRTTPRCRRTPDGSVDIYFGPSAPAGKESNWVPTDPARKFELMFRLYAPTKALFEKKWRLPDVELVSTVGRGG